MPDLRITPTPEGHWSIKAPAKLNLGLRVFPLRPDGFHPLESWMAPISWHDTLTYTPGDSLRLRITGRSEGIPAELDKNLIGRAAVRLVREANRESTGEIHLHKILPPGGGLGGGSSDAANTLVLLNHAWQLGLAETRLVELAAELGSDVPLFVRGIASYCEGRGEIMSPLPVIQPLYAVLILPAQGLATGPVFQAFDAGHRHGEMPETNWKEWSALSADALNERLINDLEPAAFSIAPWLVDLRERAARAARRKIHMTGSGSTLFTLCGSAAAAEALRDGMREAVSADNTLLPVRILK